MMNGARQRRLRRRRAMRMGGAGNRERYLPWLILGGAVLLGLGLAILLGNVLGKQTEGLPAGRDDISVTYGNIRVPGVTCEAFAFGYAVDNMKANGTNAVSVVLRGADDTLGYRSETAIHMKRQADGAVAENAGTEISYLHENGIYVCGVFRVLSAGLDGQAKSAEEYYERSLAAEIAGNGIDAILFDGLNFDGENESTSLAYLAALRRDTGDTAIGAVLPAEFFRNGNAEATLRRYLRSADFFALDLRGIGDTEELADLLDGASYCLRAFPVRLLLRTSDEAARTWLRENGYTDFQILPD